MHVFEMFTRNVSKTCKKTEIVHFHSKKPRQQYETDFLPFKTNEPHNLRGNRSRNRCLGRTIIGKVQGQTRNIQRSAIVLLFIPLYYELACFSLPWYVTEHNLMRYHRHCCFKSSIHVLSIICLQSRLQGIHPTALWLDIWILKQSHNCFFMSEQKG